MTATATRETPAQDEIDCIRERTIDRAHHCVRLMLQSLGRDHELCGKTTCARSRRCRGFACEPDIEE